LRSKNKEILVLCNQKKVVDLCPDWLTLDHTVTVSTTNPLDDSNQTDGQVFLIRAIRETTLPLDNFFISNSHLPLDTEIDVIGIRSYFSISNAFEIEKSLEEQITYFLKKAEVIMSQKQIKIFREACQSITEGLVKLEEMYEELKWERRKTAVLQGIIHGALTAIQFR
jgi:hypothetical protein